MNASYVLEEVEFFFFLPRLSLSLGFVVRPSFSSFRSQPLTFFLASFNFPKSKKTNTFPQSSLDGLPPLSSRREK